MADRGQACLSLPARAKRVNLGLVLRTLTGTGTPRGLQESMRLLFGLLNWLQAVAKAATGHLAAAERLTTVEADVHPSARQPA
jgi:hypothetical protein